MPTLKLQSSRFLRVFPSDNAKIPYPAVVTSGTNTSSTALKLINSGATFITSGVKINDIVYNTTDETAATVVSVDSETQITLNANIFTAGSKDYTIYDGASNNNGCVFYTGGAGTVDMENESGDRIIKEGCVAGQYHPVNVVQIYEAGTSATLIDAHW